MARSAPGPDETAMLLTCGTRSVDELGGFVV